MDIQEIIAFVILALAVVSPQKILLRRKKQLVIAAQMTVAAIN
jgi:hypothetical protein